MQLPAQPFFSHKNFFLKTLPIFWKQAGLWIIKPHRLAKVGVPLLSAPKDVLGSESGHQAAKKKTKKLVTAMAKRIRRWLGIEKVSAWLVRSRGFMETSSPRATSFP